MTEHTNLEPLWVGMDVDAELARYAEEDRRREQAEALAAPGSKRSPRRRSLRATLPSLERGGLPRTPLAA
jgi:hypothetical protein